MSNVYHFTDTARLPWILGDQELRPSTMAKTIGDFPDDFLWATVNEHGAQTASPLFHAQGNCNFGYREGRVWLVRFTLSAADFERWPEATKRNPAWTKAEIDRLNGQSYADNPADWWTCCGSLGREKWLSIHARTYLDPIWREIPRDLIVHTAINREQGLPVKTVIWRARAFSSMRIRESPQMVYAFSIVDMLVAA